MAHRQTFRRNPAYIYRITMHLPPARRCHAISLDFGHVGLYDAGWLELVLPSGLANGRH
jgi:hypothetical protein